MITQEKKRHVLERTISIMKAQQEFGSHESALLRQMRKNRIEVMEAVLADYAKPDPVDPKYARNSDQAPDIMAAPRPDLTGGQ